MKKFLLLVLIHKIIMLKNFTGKGYYLLFISLFTLSVSFSQTLSSTCLGTFSRKGFFFDVKTKTNTITITDLAYMAQNAGVRDMSLYYKTGSYLGFETNAGAWTLLDTLSNINPSTALACPLPLNKDFKELAICVPPNTTVSFYMIMTSGLGTIEGNTNFTTGQLVVSNADLELYCGIGQNTLTPFNAGGPFTQNMTWQGDLHYTIAAISLGADTLLCNGQTITLSPGTGYASYLWSTGDTTDSITVDTAGIYSVTVATASGCVITDTIVITYDPCLSINENTVPSLLINYDGQSQMLNVTSLVGLQSVMIFNTNGQLVFEKKNMHRQESLQMNTTAWRNGLYILKVVHDNVVDSYRFIK